MREGDLHHTGAPGASGTMDVLVAEAEPLVREIAVESLRNMGLVVAEASSAEAAFDLALAAGPPAVLVTDLKLVGAGGLAASSIGGVALATVMRRCWPEMGVLYITGHPGYLFEHDLGPRERHLRKPFSPAKLVRAVCDLLPCAEKSPRPADLACQRR